MADIEGDYITLTDPYGQSATYHYPGFSALAPDQQAQRVAQIESEWRIGVGAQEQVAAYDAELEQLGLKDTAFETANITADEFVRNFTGGTDSFLGAAVADGGPVWEGMPYLERRKAYQQAQDTREARIPGYLNHPASAAGVLGLGFMFPWNSPAQSAVSGGVVGAIEGAGNSPAYTPGGIAGDAAIGAGVGAVTGAATDVVLDKVVGGGLRGAFAEPPNSTRVPGGSAKAYQDQLSLGVPPSLGSIGNANAARLENSFAEAPITATANALLPNWAPGRSATKLRDAQVGAMDTALRTHVTDPMRPTGTVPQISDAELGNTTKELARETMTRNKAERAGMEDQLARDIDLKTPVDLKPARAVPDNFVRDGGDVNAAESMASDLAKIDKNMPAVPRLQNAIDPNIHQRLTNQKANLEGQRAQAEQQLANLRSSGTGSQTQMNALQRTIIRLTNNIERTDRQIWDNQGPYFKATRQARKNVGRAAKKEDFVGYQNTLLLDPINKGLADAAERSGGQAGRTSFLETLKRETELYGNDDVLKRYAKASVSTNATAVKQALMKGNWTDLEVLLSQSTADERAAVVADMIENLGFSTKLGKDGFSGTTFHDNWAKMPEDAKNLLFQNHPDARALADTVADVANQIGLRAGESNSSRTASVASVLAGVAMAIFDPVRFIGFLSGSIGAERVVVSEAMAKAVAGERTELGVLIRNAIVGENTAGTDDPLSRFGLGGEDQ